MADTEELAISGTAPDPAYRGRYPWHDPTWSALVRDLARLPHALLLHGADGLGKRAFAWRLAETLLCLTPGPAGAACGACDSCRRFAAGTHPDLLHVRPLEDSLTIAIDQIRQMRAFVALTPHTSARKVVMLEPAEAMNLNSANALLKVLEEPPASSLLLLITPRIARLPATIRSRCALVPFRPPALDEAVAWLRQEGMTEDPGPLLQLSGGAPLRARALAQAAGTQDRAQLAKDVESLRAGTEDPLHCATRWKNYGAEVCLEWFQRYLAGQIRAQMTERNEGGGGIEKRNGIKELFHYLDVVSDARSVASGPLDQGLLLEDILIGWSRLFRPMV